MSSAAISYVAVRGYRYYRARRTVRERGEAAKNACKTLRDHLDEVAREEGPVSGVVMKIIKPVHEVMLVRAM